MAMVVSVRRASRGEVKERRGWETRGESADGGGEGDRLFNGCEGGHVLEEWTRER